MWLNPCLNILDGISFSTWARSTQRWYMVSAKLKAAFEPSGPSWHSWTNDSGKLTNLPDVTVHKSLNNCTCFCNDKLRSKICKFQLSCEATFKPSIFNANCFRPIVSFSLPLTAASMSGVVTSIALFCCSGEMDKNFEINSMGVGLAFSLAKCAVNSDGSNRNSNHKMVSADNGTVFGRNGSSIPMHTSNDPVNQKPNERKSKKINATQMGGSVKTLNCSYERSILFRVTIP